MSQTIPASSGVRTPAAAATAPQPSALALLVMLSGTFMVVLDFFIVNVALPSIQHDLHASAAALQFVIVGYGLANAAALITGGRLGDIYGPRRLFFIGIGLFMLASAACGIAPNTAVLIAARVAQGAAGALLQPQVLAMLGMLYSGPQRAKAFAAYGLTLGLGAVSGQLIGGLLIHADIAGLAWRACFLINVPIGLLVLALAKRRLPPMSGQAASRLDLPGVALMGAALTTVLFPLVQGRDEGWPFWSLACLAATMPLLTVFWRYQRGLAIRGGQPLVAPSLITHRPFVQGLLVTVLFYAGNASFYFVLAVYLQRGLGLPPLQSGLVFTVMAGGFFVTSIASPWFARLLGRQAIFLGAIVLAAGHALLYGAVGVLHADGVAPLLPILLIQGFGLGMVMSPLVSIVLTCVPAGHMGVASGMLATVQQLGNALGVALIGIFFYGAASPQGGPHAVAQAFGASLIYLIIIAVGVGVMYRRFIRNAFETEILK